MNPEVPGGYRIEGLPPHVLVRQFYLGCLSQASYLVGDLSTGRAIAVDPRRDVGELLAAAKDDGLAIELVVETHFHADFLSGHLELAAATGSEVAFGAAGTTEFDSRSLADGEVIDLGGVQIEVLATPGHTPESISLAVRPAPDAAPVAVLTGDTLFIGDVGRPDLLVSAGVSADDLGRSLYQSVHRLLDLPDNTFVLPAHGAGSACGKSLSTETVSTIGEQRRTNYALQPMSVERFVEIVTEDQPAAPAYFAYDANLNRSERPLMDEGPLPTLTLAEVDDAVADGAVVLDTRPTEEFARGHLAGSLNVGLGGRFAEQAGSVVPVGAKVVLVGEPEALDEARVRLARIGFDTVVGALTDIEATLAERPDRASRLSRLTAAELAARQAELGAELQFVDVRNPGEVASLPVSGARNIPLADLRASINELDRSRPIVLMCAGGTRSAIASSLLLAEGCADVSDVLGGANAVTGTATACSLTS
ncbi:MAG TPA: MBL fold metallo-hydrolase [Aeromicrobium sp.]|nr:MBL fold metallo-hydrolase [Aeromicrobium sp.]HKY57441.1 MBL fold metallo-hydrolase [Aeromicrobium sp.]